MCAHSPRRPWFRVAQCGHSGEITRSVVCSARLGLRRDTAIPRRRQGLRMTSSLVDPRPASGLCCETPNETQVAMLTRSRRSFLDPLGMTFGGWHKAALSSPGGVGRGSVLCSPRRRSPRLSLAQMPAEIRVAALCARAPASLPPPVDCIMDLRWRTTFLFPRVSWFLPSWRSGEKSGLPSAVTAVDDSISGKEKKKRARRICIASRYGLLGRLSFGCGGDCSRCATGARLGKRPT